MSWLLHWLAVHLGIVNEAGPYYGFWSGSGSDIAEVAAPFVVLFGLWRSHVCDSQHCGRIGRHPYEKDGVTHKLCRRCHPALAGRRHTRGDFHRHHDERLTV